MTPAHQPIDLLVTEAAHRLGLTLGRDAIWRGRCPACGYGKPSLAIKAHAHGIEVGCVACNAVRTIGTLLGLPPEFVSPFRPDPERAVRAVQVWGRGVPAARTLVEGYLRKRAITLPVPASIRFIARQRNWVDGSFYPVMVGLVQRLAEADREPSGAISSGAHFTFLDEGGGNDSVGKANTSASKLTLGELRHGGVWLTPIEAIGAELAVAEGIETALSVAQITTLPTVAALSAAGMRSLRWPAHVRRLWIAADNDAAGLKAAEVLLDRALRAGLAAHIKVPIGAYNDFNDVIRGARK